MLISAKSMRPFSRDPPGSLVQAVNSDLLIFKDTDGDGLCDFDEFLRFHTDEDDSDSEGDGIEDKMEVYSYVFGTGRFPRKPDADGDGLRAELDPDSDNDLCEATGFAEKDTGLQTARGHFVEPITQTPGKYIDQIQVGVLAPPNSVILRIDGKEVPAGLWKRSKPEDSPSQWEVQVNLQDADQLPRYLYVQAKDGPIRKTPFVWWHLCESVVVRERWAMGSSTPLPPDDLYHFRPPVTGMIPLLMTGGPN